MPSSTTEQTLILIKKKKKNPTNKQNPAILLNLFSLHHMRKTLLFYISFHLGQFLEMVSIKIDQDKKDRQTIQIKADVLKEQLLEIILT